MKEMLCPVMNISDFLSKRWTLNILRTLNINGTRRFNELHDELLGISARTLSKRLSEMETRGIISRKRFSEIPPRVEYTLTKKGKELIDCFKHLDKWAVKWSV